MRSDEKYHYYQERANNGEVLDWLSGSRTCFSCGADVYDNSTEQEVMYGSITGCPVCHRSFCD